MCGMNIEHNDVMVIVSRWLASLLVIVVYEPVLAGTTLSNGFYRSGCKSLYQNHRNSKALGIHQD